MAKSNHNMGASQICTCVEGRVEGSCVEGGSAGMVIGVLRSFAIVDVVVTGNNLVGDVGLIVVVASGSLDVVGSLLIASLVLATHVT